MADEEGNAETEAQNAGGKTKKVKDGKGKKKKTWNEKQEDELKKKKDKFMPFGSDPCVKIRKKGNVPHGQLADIKGSHYPWFVKPRKVKDIIKDRDAKYEKENKKLLKRGEKNFKQSNKRMRQHLKDMSCAIHKRRLFEANKEPDCDETYEEYIARKDRKKRMKERRKREEADVKKMEDEMERKQKETEEEEPPKKKTKNDKEGATMLETWPGLYVTSATQDFISLLKIIIEAEFETGTSKTKKEKRPNTKKNKTVKQFKSFLNVLFTANEMMKDNSASGNKNDKENNDKRKKPDHEDKPEVKGDTSMESKSEIENASEEPPAEDDAEA